MDMNLLNQITPVLVAVLIGIIGYVGKWIVKVIPIVIKFMEAKVGLTNYQKLKAIGWDIWNVVEEHFRINEIIGDTVQAKVTMFETLIKQKIPSITDEEIETIRQAIAGEFNKDKVIISGMGYDSPIQDEITATTDTNTAAVADQSTPPAVQQVTATVKYFAPDGVTELIPATPTPAAQ